MARTVNLSVCPASAVKFFDFSSVRQHKNTFCLMPIEHRQKMKPIQKSWYVNNETKQQLQATVKGPSVYL